MLNPSFTQYYVVWMRGKGFLFVAPGHDSCWHCVNIDLGYTEAFQMYNFKIQHPGHQSTSDDCYVLERRGDTGHIKKMVTIIYSFAPYEPEEDIKRGYESQILTVQYWHLRIQCLQISARNHTNSMVYGTRRFNVAFTTALQQSLSWVESTKFPVLTPVSLRSILILSSHRRLGFPKGLFQVGVPVKILKTLLPSSILATCSAHLSLLD